MNEKDKILICIQDKVPYSYITIKGIYDITKSYDAILELSKLALKHNKNVIELAEYLYN